MTTSAQNHPAHLHPNTRQCAFIKLDGERCGTAAKGDTPLCHFHLDHQQRMDPDYRYLPPLEDARAIQAAIVTVLNNLMHNRIEKSTATGLLYGLQVAQGNLKHLMPKEDPRQKEREQKEKEREQKDEEDYETLASLLLRELAPPPDAGPDRGSNEMK